MTRFRNIIITVLAIVALLVAAMFAWYNPQPVELDLGATVVEAPLAYIVIAGLALGWLLGMLSALGWIIRLASRNRRERRATRLAETELESLRKLSADDDV